MVQKGRRDEQPTPVGQGDRAGRGLAKQDVRSRVLDLGLHFTFTHLRRSLGFVCRQIWIQHVLGILLKNVSQKLRIIVCTFQVL